jgi:methylase of polypeptide subunit release factors
VTTQPYLDKVLAHKEPYEVDVFGKPITVLPEIMSPKYDWAGLFMIDFLPKDFTGRDVLEVGPASGLVSVFVGLRGANSITAADISPKAVENTKLNLEKYNIQNSRALVSDVFDNEEVQDRKYYDIIFNLPYHDSTPQNDLEKGVMDEGYHAMVKLFAGGKSLLKDGGKMYVGFSRSGNIERFQEEIRKNNIRIERMDEKNAWDDPKYSSPDFHYNCQVYQLSFA